MAKRVLITGMSGLIGGLLKDHLLDVGGYELTALNRRVVEGVPTVQADIADLDAIRPAFEGQEVVVHLAAYLGSQDWESQARRKRRGHLQCFRGGARGGRQARGLRVERQLYQGVRAGSAVLGHRGRQLR